MKYTASIATAETDRELRYEAMREGARAWRNGKLPTECPHCPGSLMHRWWIDGYNNANYCYTGWKAEN